MTETIEGEALTFEGTPNLNAALAAVQAQLPYVGKDETADTGTYKYKYADLSAVSAAILPLLGANGLAFTAWPSVNDQGKFVLRYELLHKSGEQKAGEYPIGGGNAQQIGSAITYGRRYALCAVTGLAPGDDDDAAAAVGAREVEQAEQRQDQDRERHGALDAIKGAWFNQYGEWNGTAAADMFATWSKGGDVRTAAPGQLRAFAGYLHSLPEADAGSTPTADPQADDQAVKVHDTAQDRPLGRKDNAHMFVLFEKLGMKDDAAGQREYLGRTLERPIESRGDVRESEWAKLRAALEADVQMVEQSGLTPNQPAAGDS